MENHLEQRVSRLEEGQAELLSGMGEIRAMLTNALKNQDGVFKRINRPWQWGAVVAAFVAMLTLAGTFATVMTLTVNPIKDSVEHIEDTQLRIEEKELALHMMMKEDIEQNQVTVAVNRETLRWIEKMEERYDRQFGLSSEWFQPGGE